MIKKLKIIFFYIVLLCFSKTGYPKTIIWDTTSDFQNKGKIDWSNNIVIENNKIRLSEFDQVLPTTDFTGNYYEVDGTAWQGISNAGNAYDGNINSKATLNLKVYDYGVNQDRNETCEFDIFINKIRRLKSIRIKSAKTRDENLCCKEAELKSLRIKDNGKQAWDDVSRSFLDNNDITFDFSNEQKYNVNGIRLRFHAGLFQMGDGFFDYDIYEIIITEYRYNSSGEYYSQVYNVTDLISVTHTG